MYQLIGIGEGTNVRMRNGTECRVEDLKIGDRILTIQAGLALIVNVKKSICSNTYRVYAGRRCLVSSGDSELCVDEGTVLASCVEEGMAVHMEYGKETVRRVEKSGGGTVYSFVLEGAEVSMICNEFVLLAG